MVSTTAPGAPSGGPASPAARPHHDDPLPLSPVWPPKKSVRAVAGGRVPGQLAGRGSCGNLLSLGTTLGVSPRLLPITRLLWLGEQKRFPLPSRVGLAGRSSTRFRPFFRLVPSSRAVSRRSSKYEVLSCPMALSREHKKGTICTKLGSDTAQVASHQTSGMHPDSRSKRRSSDPAIENHQLLAAISRVAMRCMRRLCPVRLSLVDPPMPLGHSQLARNQEQSIPSTSNKGHSLCHSSHKMPMKCRPGLAACPRTVRDGLIHDPWKMISTS